MTTPSRLINEKELANLTGMSLSRLRCNRTARKGIPFLKIGRSVRYDAAEVQRFLDGCRVSTAPIDSE
jgi:predicted DNA-binding transcriptional regulator AlpA